MKLKTSLIRIGVVHTPYKKLESVPRRSTVDPSVVGTIEIFEEFAEGLLHIEGFSHIYVLTWLHLVKEPSLLVTPPGETERHGVFATRSQRRPNPVGLTLVRLLKRDGRFLETSGCDFLDQTPVIDIKPYRPEGIEEPCRFGWFEKREHPLV